ncbi:CO dehydrogenase/acetyl-CoA synthase subunit epsilon [Geoglobus acetivorans]|uniref:Acetyl-CoA decarbonylase/synthase complex subunit epsilon n=2 Tax=Geoglobus acetivorans TaxID=565033 RepID=A0A0A7GBI2_GEOAI|nr:CO dehydrogenase/acetyl-CoA synthase subunit epsilon [Geoglobus acetivorans]
MAVKKEDKYPAARRYQVADIQVSREATAVKPNVVVNLVKKAKHPVLVTGGQLLKDPKLVDFAVKFHEKGVPIIATGGSSKALIERGVKPQSAVFPLHYVTQFMLDEEWQGFDGKGPYDVVLFLGFLPYYLSRMLSALKHFSKITTISLDEFYQPHAKFSFTNLTANKEMHYQMLEEVVNNL